MLKNISIIAISGLFFQINIGAQNRNQLLDFSAGFLLSSSIIPLVGYGTFSAAKSQLVRYGWIDCPINTGHLSQAEKTSVLQNWVEREQDTSKKLFLCAGALFIPYFFMTLKGIQNSRS